MESESRTTLAEMLADGSLYEAAPPQLRGRIQARLHDLAQAEASADAARKAANTPHRSSGLRESSTEGASRGFWRFLPERRLGLSFFSGGIAGMGLSVLIGMTILRGMSSPLAPQPGLVTLEQEVVASHVRALISARAIDVLSTDQHTVKPWFNGRIDYAPPVADTTSHGFPLVGGRIDYVGERPVAVVVYRYLQHPIDLYVFPKAGGVAPLSGADTTSQLTAMSKQGYSLVEWNQGGMVFWAITDASMGSLKLFAEAIKQLTPS